MSQLCGRRSVVRAGVVWFASALATNAASVVPASSEPPVATSSRFENGVAVRSDAVTAKAHPGRLIVRYRHGSRALVSGSKHLRELHAGRDLHLVSTPPGLSVAQAVARYRDLPGVLYAEPDYELHALVEPSDPRWLEQWDLSIIQAPAAWDTQSDAGDVVVGVVDTGIDFTHADLAGNLWTNPDDGVSHGFTCMGGVVSVGGADDHGHGTHVAGTIGAGANDGIGIAGINWKVQLMALKFLNQYGSGDVSDAVLCFAKAKELVESGVNLRVTNNSWGGGGYSQALVDAMLDLEAAGVVDVCAAGNNGSNVDVDPMYPGAYDNRGIVSVLATDASDVGAGFSNYGLESVDLAAPGVATLSSVPPGPCSLCDPTGYRLLSGTSMATPHVTGVMAALLHLNPSLTAAEARDVILDPSSYDPLTDARAKSTSTGGRLNYAKAIASPLLFAPVLNQFPTVIMGPDSYASAGESVELSASGSDPDGDSLRTAWGRSTSTGRQWLFGWTLGLLFPNPPGSAVSFPAPNLARVVTVPYDAAIADDRGGGDHGRAFATVEPGDPGTPPASSLGVAPLEAEVGATVYLDFSSSDSDGGSTFYDIRLGQKYGTAGWCCFGGGPVGVTFNSPGVYRMTAQAMDNELDLSARPTAVVRIGGATGTPPIAAGTFSEISGPAPFTSTWDLSASSDPDGNVTTFCVNCGGVGFTPCTSNPVGTCTFEKPGAYWVDVLILDNESNADAMSLYAVATPAIFVDDFESGGSAEWSKVMP